MEQQPLRKPVPKASNRSSRRSASIPPSRAAAGSDGDDAASPPSSLHSEPGAAERARLRAATIPLQDIVDFVARVTARHKKRELDRKKESARKGKMKKKKQKERSEAAARKLDDLGAAVDAIVAAIEAEADEVQSAALAGLDDVLRPYMAAERALTRDMRDSVLGVSAAAAAALVARIDGLERQVAGDAGLAKMPALAGLHQRRLAMMRGVMDDYARI